MSIFLRNMEHLRNNSPECLQHKSYITKGLLHLYWCMLPPVRIPISRKHAHIIMTPPPPPPRPPPLKSHFYIVKLNFTGAYAIFAISALIHRLLVLVRSASSTHNLVLSRNINYQNFYLKIFIFWW